MDQPPSEDNLSTEADASQESSIVGSNRRRFTRNAVVGSAVLFSLGNRAAWGQDATCMSKGIFTSFVDNGNTFASANPIGGEHIEDDAWKILNAEPKFDDTENQKWCDKDPN